MWWHSPTIPALGRLRQEDPEFNVSESELSLCLMYERPCTHTHPPKSSYLHGVFIPKGRDNDQRYCQVRLGGKRTRCNLVMCGNRGTGGGPRTVRAPASVTEQDGCQAGKKSRSLEPDLLTQLARGQVFPGESSFLLGPLVGGFFPEFPFSSSPSRTKQSIIMELGLQASLFPLCLGVNTRLCQGDKTPDNAL